MIQDHIYVLIDMKVYVTSDEDLIICEARPRSLLFLSLMAHDKLQVVPNKNI